MILRLCDAVRDLLPLPAGMVADDSCTEPFKILPKRLYVYPRRTGAGQLNLAAEEMGVFADSTLLLSILYAVPNLGEARVLKATRAVSEELDELLVAAISALWENREHPFWWHIIIDNFRLDRRTVDSRALQLDISLKLNDAAALMSGTIESGS
jgi:hypothetical protein